MYDKINLQYFADTVKGRILDMTEPSKKLRMKGLRAVSDLERCGWHPAMMADAVVSVMGAAEEWAFLEGEYEVIILENIEEVIQAYRQMFGCDDDIMAQIYDVKEAAAYLDISIDTMKSHAQRWGNIEGTVKGRTMLFTRAQLDVLRREHIRG